MSQPAPDTDTDRAWLAAAIELSRRCPPSAQAFSVGAVLVAADGSVLSTGFSRELDPIGHAEEAALVKLGIAVNIADPPTPLAGQRPSAEVGPAQLATATMYSSLEPCAVRVSRPVPCADLIIASGIGRVVIAWREPPVFAPGGGAVRLRAAGVRVEVLPELAAAARAVNAHILPG